MAGEADALAISAAIQQRHMPFGTVLDPVYDSPTGNTIVGYSRCGDSALWTGAYLAAEAFRYKVTQSADALNNVKGALAGLKLLTDVTGDNRIARCVVNTSSPFAAGIANEEAHNTVHTNGGLYWIDNTSRDEVVGVFFGLEVAFDVVSDSSVQSAVSDLATRLIGFISRHNWSPNDDITSTFVVRPEELQMLLQVARHVNPSNTVEGPLFVPAVEAGVDVDVQSNTSYFKFNLDYMSFYNLVRLQNNSDNMSAYRTLRNYTASHQNAFFDMVDRALQGSNSSRDAEAASLLDQWLQRPRRDPFIDLTSKMQVCGSEACQPIPVPQRVPTDFLWQRDPFQLMGGGAGTIEGAGIDYILPYWMGRYYGVISATASGPSVQSAAAPTNGVAPSSLASLYGTNLATTTAQASAQPLSTSLVGVTVTVTDATGKQQSAPLVYVSPSQINFEIPDGTSPGNATITVNNGSATQTGTVMIASVLPTLFSMAGTGSGVAAALAIRVAIPSTNQFPVQVFQCSSTGANCVSVPIDTGLDQPVYVSFYGTGIRNRSSLSNVTVTIHGQSAPVLYAGPAPGYAGLDQVNVALPLSLRGSGESNVVLTVDGQTSNTVTINIK